MKITPLDIRRREFKRAMRGYSDEEVDAFLDEIADELEAIVQENAELRERLERAEEQIATYAQLRDALEKTLVQAQLQAEEIRANARKESELILRDAQVKARTIINDSYVETRKVQQTLAQLTQLEEEFRFKFRSLLEGYLKLLDELALAPAEIPTAAPEEAEVPVEASEFEQTGQLEVALGEDETPTEEVAGEEPELVSVSAPPEAPPASESVEASDETPDSAYPEEDTSESVQSFFFGKVTGDQADSFFEGEPSEKEKRRDFEW